jgi:undecaprenyl-diphosphatase
MWFISGKFEWIPLYIVLLFYIFHQFKWKSIWILISIAIMITLTDVISSQLIKDNVARLRPSHNPELVNLVHIVNNYRGGKFGFVSSHAANSFAIAFFLSFLFKKEWFTSGILIWAAIVSYSRIYLGVHYPGDIICGALLGLVLAIFVFKCYRYFEKRFIKSII